MMSRLVRSVIALPLAAGACLASVTGAQAQAAPAGCQGTPSGTWLRVAVGGVRNGSGLVTLSLYADDSSRFLAHHGALFTARVAARAGTTTACLFVPRPGVYAIAVYHDQNGNRKLDRSGFGLPTEGFGFSNNPSTIAGLPTFSSVRLQIPHANVATRINLRYL